MSRRVLVLAFVLGLLPFGAHAAAQTLALGDSVTGYINPGDEQYWNIYLNAGDTVDIALFSPDESLDPYVFLLGPAGDTIDQNDDFRRTWSLLPAVAISTTGWHQILARAYDSADEGSYLLKARSSGAILRTDPDWTVSMIGPAGGGMVFDSIRVANAGRLGADWELTQSGGNWLGPNPVSGTLAGGASVVVDLGVDPSGLQQGDYAITLTFTMPSDTWGGDAEVSVELRAHEASMNEFVDLGTRPYGIGVLPSDSLVVASYDALYAVDPGTGGSQVRHAGVGTTLTGLVVEPDGDVVVGDWGDDMLRRVRPDGTVEILWTHDQNVYDASWQRGDTLWWGGGHDLYRRWPDGTMEGVLAADDWIRAVEWNELDGRLYFSDGDNLRRYDPATQNVETVASFDGNVAYGMAMGRSGRLYVRLYPDGADLRVIDTFTGTVVDSAYTPDGYQGAGIVLGEDVLYGSAALRQTLFRYPVADGPIPTAPYAVLGETEAIVDTLSVVGEQDTVYLSLRSGDTVDIALWENGDQIWEPAFDVYDLQGGYLASGEQGLRRAPDAAFVTGLALDRPDVVMIVIYDSGQNDTGDYTLRTRYAGAVAATVPAEGSMIYGAAPEGGTGADTIWVYNAGRNGDAFTVATSGEGWLSVTGGGTLPASPPASIVRGVGISPAGLPAAAPAALVPPAPGTGGTGGGEDPRGAAAPDAGLRPPAVFTTAAEAPAGSVPVVLTYDASGLTQGGYTSQVTISVPTDDWGGDAVLTARLQVHDPAMETLASFDDIPWGLTRFPNGRLLVGEYGGAILEVDPETGSTSTWATIPGVGYVAGLALRSDGTLMASGGSTIYEVQQGGPATAFATANGFIRGMGIDAGDTLWVGTWYDLERVAPDGAITTFTTPSSTGDSHTGMAVDPANRRVYMANNADSAYFVFDMDAQTWATWSDTTGVFTNGMVMGRSGTVHFARSSSSPRGGELLELTGSAPAARTGVYMPDPVPVGVALGDGELFILGSEHNALYRYPLPADSAIELLTPVDSWIAADSTITMEDTLDVAVLVDVTPFGSPVTAYEATVSFDPAVLSYAGVDPGDFDGSLVVDPGGAAGGSVVVSGTGGTATAVDTATLAVLRFATIGGMEDRDTVRIAYSALGLADGTDLALRTTGRPAGVVLNPGTLTAALAADADSAPRLGAKQVHIQLDVDAFRSEVGVAGGTVTVDTALLRVDSTTAGSYGGTLAVTDVQADSGYLRWSVLSGSVSAGDTVGLLTLWVSALTDGGDSTAIAMQVDSMRSGFDPASCPPGCGMSLLPYLQTMLSVPVWTAAGTWGDVDHTWRLEPGTGPVQARDALICLNRIVGKDMAAFDTPACDVWPDDGASYNGTVSAADALFILKQVVGLDVTGSRVGTRRGGTP